MVHYVLSTEVSSVALLSSPIKCTNPNERRIIFSQKHSTENFGKSPFPIISYLKTTSNRMSTPLPSLVLAP